MINVNRILLCLWCVTLSTLFCDICWPMGFFCVGGLHPWIRLALISEIQTLTKVSGIIKTLSILWLNYACITTPHRPRPPETQQCCTKPTAMLWSSGNFCFLLGFLGSAFQDPQTCLTAVFRFQLVPRRSTWSGPFPRTYARRWHWVPDVLQLQLLWG